MLSCQLACSLIMLPAPFTKVLQHLRDQGMPLQGISLAVCERVRSCMNKGFQGRPLLQAFMAAATARKASGIAAGAAAAAWLRVLQRLELRDTAFQQHALQRLCVNAVQLFDCPDQVCMEVACCQVAMLCMLTCMCCTV